MKIEIKILNKEFYTDRHTSIDGMKTWETEYKDLPSYTTPGSAAIDLVCTKDITIYPGETEMIPTGLAIWIGSHREINGECHKIHFPYDIAGFILPRSGLGGDKGLILANTVGLIDEDYQGKLLVKAWNRNKSERRTEREDCYYCEANNTSGCEACGFKGYVQAEFEEQNIVTLKAGDRFCQLVFMPVIKAQWEIVEEFSSKTERGGSGYGSTGS